MVIGMNKMRNFFLIFLLGFMIINPQFVVSDEVDKTYNGSFNIKQIGEYLKKQEYFLDVVKLCHEESCFRVDVYDLERSLNGIEEKMFQKIRMEKGEEEAIASQLKGFSITRIITR
jgi:hypothetical protein